MTLHLHDSMTRSLRPFEPLVAGKVSMYLCGATVQAPPHIGHIRSGVNFDILRRWLEFEGSEVTFVRNVTDIDDKILAKSAENGREWWAWAALNEAAFSRAYAALGCLPPTYEPRATGHVPEMIELMRRLIDSGHAYAADGDVYFDVRSFAAYGELSGQKLSQMHPAADTDVETSKRDHLDFALWKRVKASEPATASWDTPWGRGRPGWHLECSAMATRYLGAEFDIHGGGLDLIFPHHENEIAQSVAAGDRFARFWLHNAWLTVGGEKMSKSLGNSLLVDEIVKRWRPIEVRYYLGSAHYRSHVEFSDAALDEAAAAYGRIEHFLREEGGDRVDVPAAFRAAMDDDLAVPAALAVVFSTIRQGNAAFDDGDRAVGARAVAEVAAMMRVLGLHPEQWSAQGLDQTPVIDALVQVVLEQRAAARARKDFGASDAIRDQLAAVGVIIEDTPSGARWTLKG